MIRILSHLFVFLSFMQIGFADDYRQWFLPEGATMRLGKGNLIEMVFSPDGNQLAVTSSIGIWLYDTKTYQEIRLITGEENSIAKRKFSNIAFSSDGRTLVSNRPEMSYSNADPRIGFWDINTGRKIGKLIEIPEVGSYSISSNTFSPDGKILLCEYNHEYHEGSSLRLWDIQHNLHLGTLSHKQISPKFAFSPDGKTLATVDKKGTSVLFWDVDSIRNNNPHKYLRLDQITDTLETGDTKKVNFLQYVSDEILVTGILPEKVKFWNLTTRQPTEIMLSGKKLGKFYAVALTTKMYAIVTENNFLLLIDLQTGQSTVIPTNSNLRIYALTLSSDSTQLACARIDGTVQLYDTKTRKTKATISGYNTGIGWYVYNYREELLAFSTDSKKIVGCRQLWDLDTGKSQLLINELSNYIYPAALSPNGKIIASKHRENILLSHSNSGAPITILSGHTNLVERIAFSPDGKTIASASSTRNTSGNRHPLTIRLWNTQTIEHKLTITNHTAPVTGLAFSPDGQTLASGSYDKTVRLWDPVSGEQKLGFFNQNGSITCIAFSPDGKIIAGGSGKIRNGDNKNPDTSIHLWNINSRKEITKLTGHSKDVLCIAFSPDGKTLASGSRDKTVRLWDIRTAQTIANFNGHLHPVYAVAFSPDGKTLASSSGNGTILFRNMPEKW